jgi:hypothetical protein
MECALAERGLRVIAVPLDPVVSGSVASKGVEMVFGDFRASAEKLRNQTFDCVLFLNMLHLIPDPVEVLSLFRGTMTETSVMIIQSPNMRSVPEMWRRLYYSHRYRGLGSFDQSGVHVTSVGKVGDWCNRSGLMVDRNIAIPHRRARFMRDHAKFAALLMSPSFISVATTNTSAAAAFAQS